MSPRTKIVCTMGPAVDHPDQLRRLIESGMSAARLNFSHGSHEEHLERVQKLKQLRMEMNVPLAIIVDTKGPEVRLGTMPADRAVQAGERLQLVDQRYYEQHLGDCLPLNPFEVTKSLVSGAAVLIDDGYLMAKVENEGAAGVFLRFENTGVIRSRKSVNVPGIKLNLPALTPKDEADLLFAIENELDWIAASFIRSAAHVLEIKQFLASHGGHKILVAAKIENQEGVDHFDEIVQVSDGIMVARGDLGVEVPLAQVPRLQKMMIRKACLAGKPVITATQMLESMIQNPRPTRAEVSDVANAIYDSSSGVMLSGETAVGKYPVQTVQTMRSIIEEAEGDFDYRRFFSATSEMEFAEITSSIAMAAVKTAISSKAKAIFCFTHSGHTAHLISRHRPQMRILAMTSDRQVYNQLAIIWGVDPVLVDYSSTLAEAFSKVASYALGRGWVEEGDLILTTAGSPFGVPGSTNVMMLEYVGDVLVRAQRGFGPKVKGVLARMYAPQPGICNKNNIALLNHFDASYEPYLAHAGGVVFEGRTDDLKSAQELWSCCVRLNIPLIICAKSDGSSLVDGAYVKLDPARALILRMKSSVH